MKKITDSMVPGIGLRDTMDMIKSLSTQLPGQTEVLEFRIEFILQTLNSIEKIMTKNTDH